MSIFVPWMGEDRPMNVSRKSRFCSHPAIRISVRSEQNRLEHPSFQYTRDIHEAYHFSPPQLEIIPILEYAGYSKLRMHCTLLYCTIEIFVRQLNHFHNVWSCMHVVRGTHTHRHTLWYIHESTCLFNIIFETHANLLLYRDINHIAFPG